MAKKLDIAMAYPIRAVSGNRARRCCGPVLRRRRLRGRSGLRCVLGPAEKLGGQILGDRRKRQAGGTAKIGFQSEIVAVNDVLTAKPRLTNSDTCGQSWMVRVKPADISEPSAVLTTGNAGAAPHEAKMATDAFVGCAA